MVHLVQLVARRLVVLVVVVQVQMEQPILVEVVQGVVLVLDITAVQASSLFATQIHSLPQQALQVHQRSQSLVDSVFTSGRVQARSRFDHGYN